MLTTIIRNAILLSYNIGLSSAQSAMCKPNMMAPGVHSSDNAGTSYSAPMEMATIAYIGNKRSAMPTICKQERNTFMTKKRRRMLVLELLICFVLILSVAVGASHGSLLAESTWINNRTSLTATYTSSWLAGDNVTYSATIQGSDHIEDYGEKVSVTLRSSYGTVKDYSYGYNGSYSQTKYYGTACTYVTITVKYKNGGQASLTVTE